MTVAAFLPSRLLRHLEFVLAHKHPLVIANAWRDLEDIIESRPIAVAVLDPTAEASSNTADFKRLLAMYPSLPIVAYVPLTPRAFRAVADLSQAGLEHVILHSHEDSAERMLATLNMVTANPFTTRVLERMQPWLALLPLDVIGAVENMFADPHRYQNARDIAISAKVPSVRLYRSFYDAGLAPPRNILIAAKLVRGYSYLLDPGHSVARVSKKLGYRSPRIFAEHNTEVFGRNPSQVCRHMTDSDIIERILDWIRVKDDSTSVGALRYRG